MQSRHSTKNASPPYYCLQCRGRGDYLVPQLTHHQLATLTICYRSLSTTGLGDDRVGDIPRNSGVKIWTNDGLDDSYSYEKYQVRIFVFSLLKLDWKTFASIFLVLVSIGTGQLGGLWVVY